MLPARAIRSRRTRRLSTLHSSHAVARRVHGEGDRPWALFGLIFGASTVYLGLRAGLTVSASIPIAVLAISVLKRFGGSTNAHDTRAITLSFAEPLAPLSAVRIELLPGIAGENGLPVVPADYTFTTAR